MALKDDFLRRGYFPENLPPAFSSTQIADYFAHAAPTGYLGEKNKPVRHSPYNASKRGMTRRVFSVVHPVSAYDLSEFVSSKWLEISQFIASSTYSASVPVPSPDGRRAVEITSHSDLEAKRFSELSKYRFIAKTDISRFYHSIYTHSLPWAFHGRESAKSDRNPSSTKVSFNRLDQILRDAQDGQTIGIPVGPDTSRIIAEILAVAIDLEFKKRCEVSRISVLRHVDDVWIGANSHQDAERALGRYREAIREFELDINETKTDIYSIDFRFYDSWPIEISAQLDFALTSDGGRRGERLRAVLEQTFSFAASNKDDAVLKYALSYIDSSSGHWESWETVEPFLKRSAVHFGHTIDYICRIIVWRHLTANDVDTAAWGEIFLSILDAQSRLANDSEVCWVIYACIRLNINIEQSIAEHIVQNCGALSIVALLNCIELGLVSNTAFDACFSRIAIEDSYGKFWPVLLEWSSRRWATHNKLKISNSTIERMIKREVVIFDEKRMPAVFGDLSQPDFKSVLRAIEPQSGYDEVEESNDDVEVFDPSRGDPF